MGRLSSNFLKKNISLVLITSLVLVLFLLPISAVFLAGPALADGDGGGEEGPGVEVMGDGYLNFLPAFDELLGERHRQAYYQILASDEAIANDAFEDYEMIIDLETMGMDDSYFATHNRDKIKAYRITGPKLWPAGAHINMLGVNNTERAYFVVEEDRAYVTGHRLHNVGETRAIGDVTFRHFLWIFGDDNRTKSYKNSYELIPNNTFFNDGRKLETRFSEHHTEAYTAEQDPNDPVRRILGANKAKSDGYYTVNADYDDEKISGEITYYKDVEIKNLEAKVIGYDYIPVYTIGFNGLAVDLDQIGKGVKKEKEQKEYLEALTGELADWFDSIKGLIPELEGISLEDIMKSPLFAGLTRLPLPDDPYQIIAGILAPAIVTIGLGLASRLGEAAGTAAYNLADQGLLDSQVPIGTPYDFGDGRIYEEGNNYIFDDGVEYKIINGDFIPVGQMRVGQVFTRVDGEKRVWLGADSQDYDTYQWMKGKDAEFKAADEEAWASLVEDSIKRNAENEQRMAQNKAGREYISNLEKMQETAIKYGMGISGDADDMATRINDIIIDIENGKPLDIEKTILIRDYMDKRITGQRLPTYYYPPIPGEQMMDIFHDGLGETARMFTTAKGSDGSGSWLGLGGRVGLGFMTAGMSEWLYTPANAYYTMKDAVENGSSDIGAYGQAVASTLFQAGMAELMGMGLSAAGGAAKGVVASIKGYGQEDLYDVARQGIEGFFSGVTNSLDKWGNQLADVVNPSAWKNTISGLGQSVANGGKRIYKIITGQEGYTGITQASVFPAKAQISDKQQKLLDDLNNALENNDSEKIARLYEKGNIKELADLQAQGYIKGEQAKEVNRLLKREVNKAVDKSTYDALETYNRGNVDGVRVESIRKIDSGSTGVGRIDTDNDFTYQIVFNDNELANYAMREGLEKKVVYDKFAKQIMDNIEKNVNTNLAEFGINTKDVDWAAYLGFRDSSHFDIYPLGYTGARTAASAGDVYSLVGDKIVKEKIYGTKILDMDLLLEKGFGNLTKADFKFDQVTFKDALEVIRIQHNSLLQDATPSISKVAKVVTRAEEAAGYLRKTVLGADNPVLQVAEAIRKDPSVADKVLKEYGFNEYMFKQAARNFLDKALDVRAMTIIKSVKK